MEIDNKELDEMIEKLKLQQVFKDAIKKMKTNKYVKKEITYTNEKGEYHNENGPAVIKYDNDGKIIAKYYYINGELITDELDIRIINAQNLDDI